MTEYEATFEIESKTDARTARLLVEHLHDVFREELRTVTSEGTSRTEVLDEMEAMRDATRTPSPGRVTIRYESRDDEFDG